MKAFAAGLLATVGAALLAGIAAAGTTSLRLTPLPSIAFPDRAFVLTTGQPRALTNEQVQVRENGRRAGRVSIVPATQRSGRAFGVVLVLDASDSMRGAPIAGAVAAARAFAAHRAAGEAIAVITFNQGTQVVAKPTTDASRIAAALRQAPALAVGTHLWDAAGSALDALRKARITAGSIVLLTDGTDTGSRLSAKALAAKASAAGVRVFAVGLRSKQFDPAPLRQIAHTAHGGYSEASTPGGLSALYGSLSAQLASEYLLRYRSTQAPGRSVRVEVDVDGVRNALVAGYRTPGLPSKPTPPYRRSWFDRLVSSPASVALMALLVAGLAAFAVRSLLKPRRSTVRTRVGEFVDIAGPQSERPSMTTRFAGHLRATGESLAARFPSWQRFTEELEIAEFHTKPGPLVAMTLGASLVLALLGIVSPVLVLLALAPPLVVRSIYKGKLRKRRAAFEEQLPDNLNVLAASLRAGHGFSTSLAAVVDQADEPSRSELKRAVADEQLGIPVEDALLTVAHRMDCEDLEQVALVAALQKRTGGNTAEVLDAVVASIRERFQLRRLVRALTAQGRLARWVLIGLPIVVGGWLSLVNPHYMSPLLHTRLGEGMLVAAFVLVALGSYVVKRITEIEI
jgi:tight adherence protein B